MVVPPAEVVVPPGDEVEPPSTVTPPEGLVVPPAMAEPPPAVPVPVPVPLPQASIKSETEHRRANTARRFNMALPPKLLLSQVNASSQANLGAKALATAA
jgi:hypothetical protein